MSAPRRIAMVAACPFPERRGTPLRVQRLAEALVRRGHTLHMVTYHLGDDDPLPFPVHRIPMVLGYRYRAPGPTYGKLFVLDPLLAYEIYRVVRDHSLEIVHAHHYEGLLATLPASRLLGRPCVYDAHTLLASELPSYGLGLPQRAKSVLGQLGDRWIPRAAHHVVAVTEAIRTAIVRQTPSLAPHVSVAGNGIEVEWLDDPSGLEPLRSPIDRRVVFTGNFAPYQRIDLLFRAFRRVVAERPDVRLRIVTDGKPDEAWRHARQWDVVANTEVISGGFHVVRAELARAWVAVNPRTVCVGVPQKLLNYMAAGAGIVSSEGSAALLEHGVTGLVVRNDDDKAFADAMLQLLDHPGLARRLGAHAREVVRTLTWDATALRVESAYDALSEPVGRGMRAWQR